MRWISYGVLGALIAACGSEEPAPDLGATGGAQPPPRVVACDLVPGADVEDIMGAPLTDTDANEYEDSFDSSADARYMTSCTYIADVQPAMRTATLQIARTPDVTDPAAALQDYVDGLRPVSPDLDVTPVPDIGPGAGWHAEVEQLIVFRPGWRIMVSVDRQGAIAGVDGAKLLASRALERLPGR